MGPRNFKEVPVRPISVQHRSDRFKGRREDHNSIMINRWRGNLSALSQIHNLYFICCSKFIHVYRPSFPDQELLHTPDLILTPPLTAPNLEGYVDPITPHSINRIVVAFLGNEEILLVCCDDGDVIGYRTGAIQRAIDRLSDLTCVLDDDNESSGSVTPFFKENVGKSAWGLSVHQQARMIAVSSNTRRIVVFAFALVRQEGMWPSAAEETPINRDLDYRIILPEARGNMPSCSFCNTGDDPYGRWLLATDICGNLMMFDVHKKALVSNTHCSNCTVVDGSCQCTDHPSHYPHALWGAIWLDKRSFAKQKDVSTAVGWSKARDSSLGDKWVMEISESLDEVQDKAYLYIAGRRTTESQAATTHGGPLGPPMLDLNEFIGPNETEDDNDDGGSSFSQDYSDDDEDAEGEQQDESNDPGFDTRQISASQEPDDQASVSTSSSSETASESSGSVGMMPSRYSPFGSTTRQKLFHNVAYDRYALDTLDEAPKVPILQLGLKDFTLFQPCHHFFAFPPTLYLGNPLRQHVPPQEHLPSYNSTNLSQYSRLSLTEYVPEIGVVLVGTPAGRVVVLSLTQTHVEITPQKSRTSAQEQPRRFEQAISDLKEEPMSLFMSELSMDADTGPPSAEDRREVSSSTWSQAPQGTTDKTWYAMRIDHILPFASQEVKGERPERLLCGLCVGPVQGTEKGAMGPNRWRLFLTYQDHSVLVYEMGRREEGGFGGIGTTGRGGGKKAGTSFRVV